MELGGIVAAALTVAIEAEIENAIICMLYEPRYWPPYHHLDSEISSCSVSLLKWSVENIFGLLHQKSIGRYAACASRA